MVGSAIARQLQAAGETNIVTRTHAELDLTDQPLSRGNSIFMDGDCGPPILHSDDLNHHRQDPDAPEVGVLK